MSETSQTPSFEQYTSIKDAYHDWIQYQLDNPYAKPALTEIRGKKVGLSFRHVVRPQTHQEKYIVVLTTPEKQDLIGFGFFVPEPDYLVCDLVEDILRYKIGTVPITEDIIVLKAINSLVKNHNNPAIVVDPRFKKQRYGSLIHDCGLILAEQLKKSGVMYRGCSPQLIKSLGHYGRENGINLQYRGNKRDIILQRR